MDDHAIAALVLAECPLYAEITELAHGELRVRKPVRARTLSRFRYDRWIKDAREEGWESIDVYVEYGGELLWAGEILDGLGVAPFLRNKRAMQRFASKWDPFDDWSGFCTECNALYQRNCVMVEIRAEVWECPECGSVEYHAQKATRTSRVPQILEGLLEDGLPGYRDHIRSCMEAN